MTSKEKAEDLVSKYLWPQRAFKELAKTKVAKECALIAVDEILEYVKGGGMVGSSLYWKEVKKEIDKL